MSKRSDESDENMAAQVDGVSEEQPVTGLAEYNAEVLAKYPGMVQAFMAMLQEVAQPSNEDATARIVGTILQAETVEELNKPWDSDGMRKHFGELIVVRAITRRPSDYTGGLGVYLGCEITWPGSGEESFLSCGSVSSVAQLVRAHAIKRLPLLVMPVKATRPTKLGYWPYHLDCRVIPAQS